MKDDINALDMIQSESIDDEINRIVDDLTLFDDELMSKVFDNNVPAAELLLRIILERDDIKVRSVKGQEEFKNPYPKGRNIRLDIHAIDGNGVEFDVEVQRNKAGSHPRRTRFHGSMMDTRMLKELQEFKDLKDAYIIFICQHDKFKENKPIYHIDKTIRETGNAYEDGSHIIFVNGAYRGDDSFGFLAHDFNCKTSKRMHYKEFAEGVKHFKETEKGRETMCESVERYANEKSESSRINTLAEAVKMLMKNTSVSLEQAFSNLGITDSDQKLISKRILK